MKAKIIATLVLFLASPAGQALACAVCSVGPESKTGKSMAMAVWFLMAAIMGVLGCVGLFGFHLWRHGRMPLEPHQELVEEDFKQYD